MPQIIFKGIKEETMAKISKSAIEKLALDIDCPEDFLILELNLAKYYDKNGELESRPTIQVWWFKREKNISDRAAKTISEILFKEGYNEVQVSFHDFDKNLYYEFENK